MNELATTNQRDAALLEQVVINGDLSKLTPKDRVAYYAAVCKSVALNPLTKPFDYINLNGKLTLYARRDCTDQLRGRDHISVNIIAREKIDDLFVVTARATTPDGRTDESIGAVNIKGLTGENLANAMMKAETKAKRRATLSLAGLGFTDESEVSAIEGAAPVKVDMGTGEILEGELIPNAAATMQGGQAQQNLAGKPISEKQIAFLYECAKRKGIEAHDAQFIVRRRWECPVEELRSASHKEGAKWVNDPCTFLEAVQYFRESTSEQIKTDMMSSAADEADISLSDDPEQHTLDLG
jgi:hypothetical protein